MVSQGVAPRRWPAWRDPCPGLLPCAHLRGRRARSGRPGWPDPMADHWLPTRERRTDWRSWPRGLAGPPAQPAARARRAP